MKKFLIFSLVIVLFFVVYIVVPRREGTLGPAEWTTPYPLTEEQKMAQSCEWVAQLDRETTWSDKMKPHVQKSMAECIKFYDTHPDYNSYEIMKDACTNPVYTEAFGTPSADLKCESFK